METAHLTELKDLESTYWWHVAKRSLATSLLSQYTTPSARIVEGGIGAGGNLRFWQSQGFEVHGLDIMPESVAYARQCGLENVHQHDLHDPWPVPAQSAEAVVLLDVLEHVRDPVKALQNAAQTLVENGSIIFTVPAHPWLFSEWDERLGHFRRYTQSMIREQVEQAGLRIVELRPWNAISLPIAVMLRTFRRVFPKHTGAEFPRVSQRLNRWLIQIQECERHWSSRFTVPFGLSYVGVISK
ncbi:MAG: class I SAM-dependent methyltransferase [Pirellulaceae bacterium]|nr:class I SAM-dependent methyltransferase [Pirellulaceae bacterium]